MVLQSTETIPIQNFNLNIENVVGSPHALKVPSIKKYFAGNTVMYLPTGADDNKSKRSALLQNSFISGENFTRMKVFTNLIW